jgi:hypothetical protein
MPAPTPLKESADTLPPDPPSDSATFEPDDFPPRHSPDLLATPRASFSHLEASVSTTVDRSLSDLKRCFSHDLRLAFRSKSPYFDTSPLDTFASDLISDLQNLLDPSASQLSKHEQQLLVTVHSTFDDGEKSVRELLEKVEHENSSLLDQRLKDLKEIWNCLLNRRRMLASTTNSVLNEVEKRRTAASIGRSETEKTFCDLSRRSTLNSLRLIDLSSQLEHDKRVKVSLRKLRTDLISRRRELNDQNDQYAGSIQTDLLNQVQEVESVLRRDCVSEMYRAIGECTADLKKVRDCLRDDLYDVDVAEKRAVARLRSPMRRPPAPRAAPVDYRAMSPARVGQAGLWRRDAQERVRFADLE